MKYYHFEFAKTVLTPKARDRFEQTRFRTKRGVPGGATTPKMTPHVHELIYILLLGPLLREDFMLTVNADKTENKLVGHSDMGADQNAEETRVFVRGRRRCG